LDRTQPGLPMKKGRCQTMTHDYKRNGTTTLLAALNTATADSIDKHNESPKPTIWTAKANDVLEKVTRAQASRNHRLSA